MSSPVIPRDPPLTERLLLCAVAWALGWCLHGGAIYGLDPSRHWLTGIPGLALMTVGGLIHVAASAAFMGFMILDIIRFRLYLRALGVWMREQDGQTITALPSESSLPHGAPMARAELRRRERECAR